MSTVIACTNNTTNNTNKGNKMRTSINTSAKAALASMIVGNKVTSSKLDGQFCISTRQSFAKGEKMLGTAANSDMLISSLMVDDTTTKKYIKELLRLYPYSLGAIVDASVQGDHNDESRVSEKNLTALLEYVILDLQAPVPICMKYRVPFALRDAATYILDHQFQDVIELAKELVDQMDKHILGEGSQYAGDRVEGMIDTVNVDYTRFICKVPNYLLKASRTIKGEYNNSIRKLMIETKSLPLDERSDERKTAKNHQLTVLKSLVNYNYEERKSIIRQWAADIYMDGSIHDSILFVDSMESNGTVYEGVFDTFIEILADLGLAKRVKTFDPDTTVIRQILGQKQVEKTVDEKDIDESQFRLELKVWRTKKDGGLTADMVKDVKTVDVVWPLAEINGMLVNINASQSNKLDDGRYTISETIQLLDRDKVEISTGVKFLLNPITNQTEVM